MGHNNGTAPGCVAGLGKPGAAPLLVVASGKKARRRAPFKQAYIARAVKGVQKAGLPVAAVKVEPGGTILVDSRDTRGRAIISPQSVGRG